MSRTTLVQIEKDKFFRNGAPLLAGKTFEGMDLEGLLLNARLVQGAFDDLNPQTRSMWTYPDGPWDPQRNTREFIEAMPIWQAYGLDGFTINLQGGSPQGYSKHQPWINSTFTPEGALRPDYLARFTQILDRADELGMVVILGFFYFGQDEHLADESAVIAATDAATDWLCEAGYTHVLVEINNEVDVPKYEHEILTPPRIVELIRRVQDRSKGRLDTPPGRLLVSTSHGGGTIPRDDVIEGGDFVLIHGNGVGEPDRIRRMVRDVRASGAYTPKPILFNEDDHFDFGLPDNNFRAAVSERAGWGYFDFRMEGEGFDEGYQSVPVNWGISSQRKRGFFELLKRMTGR